MPGQLKNVEMLEAKLAIIILEVNYGELKQSYRLEIKMTVAKDDLKNTSGNYEVVSSPFHSLDGLSWFSLEISGIHGVVTAGIVCRDNSPNFSHEVLFKITAKAPRVSMDSTMILEFLPKELECMAQTIVSTRASLKPSFVLIISFLGILPIALSAHTDRSSLSHS